MTTPDKNVDEFFELMQRFVRVRPHFVAPEPLARFRRELDRLPGTGQAGDRTSIYRLLIVLAQSSTPPSMGELSANLGVPLSTATRVVDWLVAGGFAERTPDPKDRRTIRIRLTAKGQKIYGTFADFNRQRITRLLRDFSAGEQAQLLKLLNRLLDSFQAEGPQ